MNEPIESVVRVASTPSEAKIFVAMLRAEGIPARTDGDSLVDEFAASQRLMNLIGTKVIVPTRSLARAREILQPEPVDPVELERAALAASPEPIPIRRATEGAATTSSSNRLLLALLALATGAAVLFAFLWQNAKLPAIEPSPDLGYQWDGNALAETMLRTKRLLRLSFDRDHDGIFEVVEQYGADENKVAVSDQYSEGIYLRIVETRGGGLTATWTDEDRDGLYDAGVVTDATGKVLQRLHWRDGKGFELLEK